MKPVFLPILLGTNRQGRQSEKVARFLLQQMNNHPEIETKLFDVRDFKIPADDYGPTLKDLFPEYRDALIRADGLVVIAPEYNHGYPGILKSVMDVFLKEYIHKAVGLVGVSAGPWGGTRVIESMVPMVRELGLACTFTDLNFPSVQNVFSETGELLDQKFVKRTDGFLKELIWMSCALRWGRQNLDG